MQDRIPLYPGRVKLNPVTGQENTYDMVRADEPVQEGTPLNKANLLTDEVAAEIAALTGAAAPVTPNEAFSSLREMISNGVKIEIGSYTGTGTYGVDNPNSLTFEFEPKLVFIYGVSYSSGGKLTSFIPSSSYWSGCCIWAAGVTSTYIGSSSTATNFIQSGNSLKWYITNSADGQLNSSGYIYNYVAIG